MAPLELAPGRFRLPMSLGGVVVAFQQLALRAVSAALGRRAGRLAGGKQPPHVHAPHLLGSPRGQGARQAPPHGFGRVGSPTASGLVGRRSRRRNRRRSLRTDTTDAASAADAMASGPPRVLSRMPGTITKRRRQRKTTGRGTWRRSPGNGTPPGAGVGRVCWVAGGLPLAELHGR